MSNNIIEASDLCKSFNNQKVLENLSINIKENQFTVIMGVSGAGKSTLMYSLSGMDRCDEGKILFAGKDITELSNDKLAVFRRKNCGFVFQKGCFIDNLSIIDNIVASGILVNSNKKEVISRAKSLLQSVNLKQNIWSKYPNQVSGGELQRAGIVRAMINKPTVIFADEPTGALNSANGIDVLNNLTKINQEGQSIIMVTHDVLSACRADRIIYLKDGKVCGEHILSKFSDSDENRKENVTKFLIEMGW